MPADAIGVVSFNLDPGATQTVNTLKFLHTFPSLGTKEDGNLIDGVVRAILKDSEDLKDFDQDVRPWLGSQIAVAVDPQGDEVRPLVVAEVTDQDKARAGLTHIAGDDDDMGWVFQDDYVIISESTKIAETAATDAQKASIADDDTYQKDIAALGDDESVMRGWADLARVPTDGNPLAGLPALADAPLTGLKGRVAVDLRFGPKYAELYAKTFGEPTVPTSVLGPDVTTLPSDTSVAIAVSGLDKTVERVMDAVDQAGLTGTLDTVTEETGVKLPDDLLAVLGDQAVFAADGGPSDFGLIASGDPDTAKQTADRILTALGVPGIATGRSGDRTVLATSPDYVDQLTAKGDLGKQDAFRAAVPDASGASVVVYVDMGTVLSLAGEELPDDVANLKSVGLTGSAKGDTATVRLRLVTK